MVNIRVIHSLTLLQESWKLLLETQKDYHVLTYKNNYRDLPPTHEDVDIILMDLPNFLRYSEETPSFSLLLKRNWPFSSKQAKNTI